MIDQKALLKAIKDAWDHAYEDVNKIENLPWVNTESPVNVLSDFINSLQTDRKTAPIKILDFGCGSGRIGRFVEKTYNCQVFYYDISENALIYCKTRGVPQERIIFNLTNCEERFDGIIVWGVFHHMAPQLWDSQLELVMSMLLPEGKLLFGDFTREDILFTKENRRTSEVTGIFSYAVDFEFLEKSLNKLKSGDFSFCENVSFSDHRDSARRMKYIIAERNLVEKKEAIVRQMIEGMDMRPQFWHFVKYAFKDSLAAPHGNAVTFIRESDPRTAQKLWLDGLTLFHCHDDLYSSNSIGNKSLTEELFLHSNKKHSFYLHGIERDHVSVSIKWKDFENFGYYDICLYAPLLNITKPSILFSETHSFGVFIRELREISSGCIIEGSVSEHIVDAKEKLDEQLIKYTDIPSLPALMMLLMVWPSVEFPRKSFVFILPPVFEESVKKKTIEISAGGLIMLSNKNLASEQSSMIPALTSAIIQWAGLYTTKELVKYSRLKSVGAAIAQVMARNMSHNFGSHVLSNFISLDAYDKMRDEQVSEVQRYASIEGASLSSEVFDKGNRQVSYFIQYLKSRMDYLSEVTFGVSDMITTKMMFGDVMKELDRVRLLLNHISGVGDFNYCFNLLKYDGKTDKPLKDNDIRIAFPNDILGCQAFYNIVENIIRNTAKHHTGGGVAAKTVFTIRIKDISVPKKDVVEGINDLFCIEIDDGLRKDDIDSLVPKQNERFNESVLDANNNLRSHSLGLLEMKASAAFLRQIDLTDIVSDSYKIDTDEKATDYHTYEGTNRLNIIKAFKAPINDGGYALGYRFFLQKPKEFLFVGDEWLVLIDNQKQNELNNTGIHFVKTADFKSSMGAGEAFAHQFLIYDNASKTEVLKKQNQSLLPLRLLDDEGGAFARLIQKANVSELLHSLKEAAWRKQEPEKVVIKGVLQDSFEKQIVLKHHKDTYQNDFLDVFRKKNYANKEVWIENLTSRTMYKMPEFSSYASDPEYPLGSYLGGIEEQDEIVSEIYEAYHSRVIIIDERVQQYAEESEEDSIPCWKLFESTNVHIPRFPNNNSSGILHSDDNVIPLAPDSFSAYTEKFEQYIDKRIKDSFLIIHYGVLERMYNRDEFTISEHLSCWADKGKRVVVTSGRGAHSLQLPDTVCFASLSSVLYVCNENRNKYLINYLINQARRKRK